MNSNSSRGVLLKFMNATTEQVETITSSKKALTATQIHMFSRGE